jgi:hypothetical protein
MLRIDIGTGNAAFDGNPESEIARILRGLADRYESEGIADRVALYDANGNRVGKAEYVA